MIMWPWYVALWFVISLIALVPLIAACRVAGQADNRRLIDVYSNTDEVEDART
jgi:hypothetical protein